MFLNGLNDDIQFQLLNMDYTDFQHMADKVVVLKTRSRRWRRMTRGRYHSMDNTPEATLGLASHSLTSSSNHHR
jgi:hypothetical protein